MSSANDKSEEGDRECITLKVLGQDSQDPKEIHFKVKITNTMGKLKRKYAEKQGVPHSSLKFLLEGRRIDDNDTPEQLQMKTDTVIEVYAEQPCSWSSDGQDVKAKSQLSQLQIRRQLECIGCLEPAASPIYTCLKEGHLVCGFCHDKLKITATVCPCCKCETQPSPLAERQSRENDMVGNCPFLGCFDRVLAVGLMTHVKNCEYREIECTRVRIGGSSEAPCNKMFPLDAFPLHAVRVHKTMLTRSDFESLFVAFRLDVPFSAGNEESEKYWGQQPTHFGQLLCEYNENYFTVHQAVGNYMFFWWVTIFGGQKEADRYNYETELLWKNAEEQKAKSLAGVQIVPVLPYNGYEKYESFCGNKYAMVHAATATAYSAKKTDDPQMRRLILRIKISETTKSEKRTADTTDEPNKKTK